jgi:putative redox protein
MRASARLVPGTLRSDVLVRGRFHLLTDEPETVGGEDTAPAPHELLPAALASCIATTLAMYARTKEWDLGDVEVDVVYHRRETPLRFEVEIRLGGDLTPEQLRRLEKVAATCPVRRSIETGAVFEERIATTAPVG